MEAGTIEVHVPGMRDRHDVRVISRAIRDLDVATVEADVVTTRVVVRGEVAEQAVRDVIERAGYEVEV